MPFPKYLIFFFFSYLLLSNGIKAQTTPYELGRFLFNSFHQGSITNIDQLIPTIEEMKQLGDKLGIKRDSKKFTDALNRYQAEIDTFHEIIQAVFSDTLDDGLRWSMAKLEKITKSEDSIRLDNRNPDSKTAPVTRVKIYFSVNAGNFIIFLDDVFEVNGLWKTGNSVYVRKLE